MKNTGSEIAKSVKVQCAYFDEENNILEVNPGRWYTDPSDLAANDTGEFEISSNKPNAEDINSYQLWVKYSVG